MMKKKRMRQEVSLSVFRTQPTLLFPDLKIGACYYIPLSTYFTALYVFILLLPVFSTGVLAGRRAGGPLHGPDCMLTVHHIV